MNDSKNTNDTERGKAESPAERKVAAIGPAWLDYLKPALIVMLIGAGVVGLNTMGNSRTAESTRVKLGSDYYVSVALVEVSDKNDEGVSWDHYNGTGPDIRVEIFWKGNRIYKSNKKEDTFLAKWSNAELDLRDLALSGKNASMDDVINAARVTVRDNDSLEIRVEDDDLLTADAIGNVEIRLQDLHVGDNVFTFDQPGVKRMVIRVNDMAEPVDVLK
jgi:hypothetical protein